MKRYWSVFGIVALFVSLLIATDAGGQACKSGCVKFTCKKYVVSGNCYKYSATQAEILEDAAVSGNTTWGTGSNVTFLWGPSCAIASCDVTPAVNGVAATQCGTPANGPFNDQLFLCSANPG
jgi:hypothetical protein